jgi:hypothetical protein
LLDAVQGHVNFDLILPIYVYGMRPDTWQSGDRFKVRVAISGGEVDVAKLEDEAAGGILDKLIDFEVEHHRLVLQLDLTAYTKELVSWDLTRAEEARADKGFVPLRRLIVPRPSTSTGPGPAEIDLGVMAIADLDVLLGIANESAIDVSLPGGVGEMRFAPETLRGLRITAPSGVPGRPGAPPRMCAETPALTTSIEMALDWLRLEKVRLALPYGELTTGAIRIEDVRNARLELERLASPSPSRSAARRHDTALGIHLTSFSGVVGTLRVENAKLVAPTGGPGRGP